MIKKYKKENYENLHGQELIDALMKDNTLGTIATEEQNRESIKLIAEKNRKLARSEAYKDKVADVLKSVFFPPLAILFHVVTFALRIIGGIASVVMLYGIYNAYKAFVAWRAGEVFANYMQNAIMMIVFPFITFAIATLSGKVWQYFDDNK